MVIKRRAACPVAQLHPITLKVIKIFNYDNDAINKTAKEIDANPEHSKGRKVVIGDKKETATSEEKDD